MTENDSTDPTPVPKTYPRRFHPAGCTGLAPSLLDDLRGTDAKPLSRQLVTVIDVVSGESVERDEALYVEMMSRLDGLCDQLNARAAAADAASAELVKQLNTIFDGLVAQNEELRRHLGLVVGRQEAVELAVRSQPASIDTAALVREFVAALPSTKTMKRKDILRDADGEISSIVEY